MSERLEVIGKRFVERVRSPRAWSYVAYEMPRMRLTALIALVAPALLVVAVLLGPSALDQAVTDPVSNREVFSRFISGIVTAATIAVSFATLALRRGIQGVGGLLEHIREDDEYRRDVRQQTGRATLPLVIGPFLAQRLEDVVECAERVHATSGKAVLAHETSGVALGDYLDALCAACRRASEQVSRASRAPNRMMMAALDFEEESSGQLARLFERDERLPLDVRESLTDLRMRIEQVTVARGYAKTLAMQWGLSRMSTAIVISAFVAILAATAWSLAYGEWVRDAVGVGGAVALLGVVLFLLTLPLAAFLSYVLRFVFLNEHSLPIGAFVLGPEQADLLDSPEQRRVVRRRGERA